MIDLAQFRVRFPEFVKVGDSLVQACLDEAALEIDQGVWDTRQNTGHGLLAAHKLAISPFGQAARLSSDKGGSTYKTEFDRLCVIVAGMSFRVI